jgi:hypothetical protein
MERDGLCTDVRRFCDPRFESQYVQEMFSSSEVRNGFWTHPASYSVDIGGFFPRTEDFQSNVCFVEVQTESRCIHISLSATCTSY